MSDTAAVDVRPRILSRTGFVALIVLLVAATISSLSAFSGITLLVMNGTVIIGWQLGSPLLVPAVVLGAVAAGMPYRRNSTVYPPSRLRTAFSLGFPSRAGLVGLGVVCAGFNFLTAGAAFISGYQYSTVPSPGGCVVVIRQSSGFGAESSATRYLLQGHWGLAQRDTEVYDFDDVPLNCEY